MLLLVLVSNLMTLTQRVWEVSMTAYLSYTFVCSCLPYVKDYVCYFYLTLSQLTVGGPNALRQFEVRDASTCKTIMRNVEKMPYVSIARDITGNMNVPTGWIISSQPKKLFFVMYTKAEQHNGMHVTVWCSGRTKDALVSNCDFDDNTNTPKEQRKLMPLADMEANVAWGEYAKYDRSVGSLKPAVGSKQESVLHSCAATFHANINKKDENGDPDPSGTVLMIVGGSRTGKTTTGGIMLANLIEAAILLEDFDFTDPGQWLLNVLRTYGPSPTNPVVLVADECDVLFEKINEKGDKLSMKNTNVRTQCTDKKSLNGFLDKVRNNPGMVLVLTSNKTPTEMLESGIVHWSSIYRTHAIHFLNEPLAKGNTRPVIDGDLPGADLLEKAIAGEVPKGWSM